MNLTLTFDNGPDPEVTARVLDVLLRRDLRAHFFVLGKQVATPAGQALVERAVAEGHQIGNHSYSHAVPLGDDLRNDAVEHEIAATQALLEPLLRAPPVRRFRPFGGGGVLGPHLLSPAAVAYLTAHGFTVALWNAVPHDWEAPADWPARALAELDRHDHTVLVLHDIAGACLGELDGFLAAAADRGARFVLELPLTCTPIVDGHVLADLAPLMRAPSG